MIIRGKEMETEKNNLIVKTTGLVLNIVSSYVQKGDFAIDCTMGNGNDTLSLVKLTGADGSGGDPAAFNGSTCQVTYEQIAEKCGDDVSTWGSTMQCESSGAWEVYSVAVWQNVE